MRRTATFIKTPEVGFGFYGILINTVSDTEIRKR